MKTRLSKEELLKELYEQVSSIESLCSVYDSGQTLIFKDIAIRLRVLLYNTPNCKSLLGQLKLTHIVFLDSSNHFNYKSIATFHGLTKLSFKNGDTWIMLPHLDVEAALFIPFEKWWQLNTIIRDKDLKRFTRKDIVSKVANQDGGAHVDPGLDTEYYNLSRKNTINWWNVDSSGKEPINNPVPPSIRQMAFELIQSLKRIDPEKESKLR